MFFKNKFKITFDKFAPWDMAFAFWFICEYCFYHSVIDTVSVIVFIAITFFFVIQREFRLNIIIPWIGVFIIISYLNIILGYSINGANSYAMLNTMVRDMFFLTALVLYVYNVQVERFMDNIITASLASTVLIIVLSVVIKGTIIVRDANDFFNANYLAVCDSIASIIILSKENIKITKRIRVILFFVLFGALAGTRKAIIVFIIGIVVFYCVKYPKKLIKNVLIFSVLFVVTYISLIKIPILYNTIGYRFESAINFINGGKGDGSIYMRSWYIETGISKFYESPIWGHGLNCFRTLKGARGTYSHNNYVELLFSLGLIGTISYYSIHIYSLLYGLFNFKKLNRRYACIGFAVLVMVIFSDYAMVGYYERSSLLYIVLVYMLLVQSNQNRFGIVLNKNHRSTTSANMKLHTKMHNEC